MTEKEKSIEDASYAISLYESQRSILASRLLAIADAELATANTIETELEALLEAVLPTASEEAIDQANKLFGTTAISECDQALSQNIFELEAERQEIEARNDFKNFEAVVGANGNLIQLRDGAKRIAEKAAADLAQITEDPDYQWLQSHPEPGLGFSETIRYYMQVANGTHDQRIMREIQLLERTKHQGLLDLQRYVALLEQEVIAKNNCLRDAEKAIQAVKLQKRHHAQLVAQIEELTSSRLSFLRTAVVKLLSSKPIEQIHATAKPEVALAIARYVATSAKLTLLSDLYIEINARIAKLEAKILFIADTKSKWCGETSGECNMDISADHSEWLRSTPERLGKQLLEEDSYFQVLTATITTFRNYELYSRAMCEESKKGKSFIAYSLFCEGNEVTVPEEFAESVMPEFAKALASKRAETIC